MYNWNNEQLKSIWKAVDGAVRLCKESFEKSEPNELADICKKDISEKRWDGC